MPSTRRNTADSDSGSITWLRRRTTTSSTLGGSSSSSHSVPQLFVETYYAYADLDWEKLKEWLEKKFEGHTFDEDYRDDHFVFKIPRRLTKAERDEINELRDKNEEEPKRAQPDQ